VRKWDFGGVLTACAAVALSFPTHADQYDVITQLDSTGVSYASTSDMIEVGKAVCHDLPGGKVTPPVVLDKLRAAGSRLQNRRSFRCRPWTTCARTPKAGVVAWARGDGYTGPMWRFEGSDVEVSRAQYPTSTCELSVKLLTLPKDKGGVL
jgi:hypothetical protein